MPGHFILRPASAQDDAFLRAVYASSRDWEFAGQPWPPEEKNAFLRQQYDCQDRYYRSAYAGAAWSVITVNGEDAGRLIVHRGAAALEIMDIALLEAWRGHGTGTAIIRSLMEEAAASCLPVRIWVESANPARRLYERLAFRHISDHGPHREYLWTPAPGVPPPA
jgi:GNAT superfamily N-acetyltransferase